MINCYYCGVKLSVICSVCKERQFVDDNGRVRTHQSVMCDGSRCVYKTCTGSNIEIKHK